MQQTGFNSVKPIPPPKQPSQVPNNNGFKNRWDHFAKFIMDSGRQFARWVNFKFSELKYRFEHFLDRKSTPSLGPNHLVKTSNIGPSNLFKQESEIIRDLEAIRSGSNPEVQRIFDREFLKVTGTSKPIIKIRKKTEEGICHGMCVDLSTEILKLDLHSETFENDLINSVKKNAKVGRREAVANQIHHHVLNKASLMPTLNFSFLALIERLERGKEITLIQREMIETALFMILDIDEVEARIPERAKTGEVWKKWTFIKERVKKNTETQDGYSEFINRMANQMDPQQWKIFVDFLNAIKNKFANKSTPIGLGEIVQTLEQVSQGQHVGPHLKKAVEYVEGFTAFFARRSTQLLKRTVVIKPEVNISTNQNNSVLQKIVAFAQKVFSKKVDKPQTIHRTVINLIELQRSDFLHFIDDQRVAASRSLKLNTLEDKLGVWGSASDNEKLDNLNKLDPGVYFMKFKTGNSSHATMFIRAANGSYFFDPNYGLIKCDHNNPKKQLQEVLSLYETLSPNSPHGKLGFKGPDADHLIQLSKIEKL